jgi:peptide/nickel transport system ATP-binding protein
LLEVSNLILYYRTKRGIVKAVDKMTFHVNKGETLGLVGESGCGKSSTAIALMRLLPRNIEKYEGKIVFDNLDLMNMNNSDFRTKIRWQKMSIVFQGAMNSLNPVLKVGQQVAEPLVLHQNIKRKESLTRVQELFKLVGLPPTFVNRYPHELSGGMKQRAIIAMSLILSPNLVILDEPTSALDVSIQAQIMNLLKRLKKDLDISFIFITHDVALASDLCDKIGVMYAGQLVEIGSSEEVLLKPAHPYTQKLISSVPLLRGDRIPDYIPGAPPDLVDTFKGCRFYPRCSYRKDEYEKNEPFLTKIDKDHYVKCWLYGGSS